MVLVIDATGSAALMLDEAARLPGRGAWLHPDLDCLALAERRRVFGRALRHAGPVDARPLRDRLVARVGTTDQDAGRPGNPGPTSANREAG